MFVLADAPREWWLRLSRSMAEHGWCRTLIDAAMRCFWVINDAGEKTLEAVVVAHVDDLLFAGGAAGKASLDAIGAELGLGSCETDFTWCGKRIRRASDGTVCLSMHEYHESLTDRDSFASPPQIRSIVQAGCDGDEDTSSTAWKLPMVGCTSSIRYGLSGVNTSRREPAHDFYDLEGELPGEGIQIDFQI